LGEKKCTCGSIAYLIFGMEGGMFEDFCSFLNVISETINNHGPVFSTKAKGAMIGLLL